MVFSFRERRYFRVYFQEVRDSIEMLIIDVITRGIGARHSFKQERSTNKFSQKPLRDVS